MIQLIIQAQTLEQALILGTSFLVAIFFAIVLHEIAHGYAALWNGDNTAKVMGRLSLNPVKHFDLLGFAMLVLLGFGYAKPVPISPRNFRNYKKGMIWVSVAGVLTNLALAFLLFPLERLVLGALYDPALTGAAETVLTWVYGFLLYSVIININLALFNILPLAPLDGFNLLSTLAGPYNRVVVFLRKYSYIILIALLVMSSVPFASNFSPLTRYIEFGQGIIQWLYGRFWSLLGLA